MSPQHFRKSRQSLCFVAGCGEPSVLDADECRFHLDEWEREEAREGRTGAVCAEGHSECAHHNRGACHNLRAEASGYNPRCPDRNAECIWTEKPEWLEEES